MAVRKRSETSFLRTNHPTLYFMVRKLRLGEGKGLSQRQSLTSLYSELLSTLPPNQARLWASTMITTKIKPLSLLESRCIFPERKGGYSLVNCTSQGNTCLFYPLAFKRRQDDWFFRRFSCRSLSTGRDFRWRSGVILASIECMSVHLDR